MDNRHMKRCATLLIIKEVQGKTKVKYHLTLGRMAIIWKSTNNSGNGVEKGESSSIVCGNVEWYSHDGKQYGGSLKNWK